MYVRYVVDTKGRFCPPPWQAGRRTRDGQARGWPWKFCQRSNEDVILMPQNERIPNYPWNYPGKREATRPFSEKTICQKVATLRPSRLRQIEQNYFSQFKVRVLVELLLQQETGPPRTQVVINFSGTPCGTMDIFNNSSSFENPNCGRSWVESKCRNRAENGWSIGPVNE